MIVAVMWRVTGQCTLQTHSQFQQRRKAQEHVQRNQSCTLQPPGCRDHSDSVNMGFQGKWMYEVTLGTAGIMQLGWATAGCQFSNEEGVGDSVDSYAYDGKASAALEHQL